ncbi:MATH and LRR domain-containing protein PFE0570w-like isoform X2 [Bombus affinis]|nr:MATH and LRR domain-containing protein PFE0570w-like isoform X2 [Bombus affinis]
MEEQLQELSHRIFQTNNKIYPNRYKVKNSNNIKGRNDMSHSKSKLPIITAAGNEDSDDMLDSEDVTEATRLNRTSKPDYTKPNTKTKSTSSYIKETKYQDQEMQHSNNIKTKFDDDIMKDKENVLDKKDIQILINERIKFRLEKLIQNHSDGIWCADLPEKYLEEYKVPLNYAELGFNSVREFASQLPEIFHCIQPRDTGDFMLYYAKREIPSNKLTKKHEANNIAQWYNIYESSNEEAVPASVSLDTCKKLIPDNVMSIGDYVGYINVADLEQDEEPFIEVIVVEVFTPSFFWIQLRKKQKTFKMFMDDLHKFYTVQYEQYAIPLLVLEKGLNCACVYNGIWHRGIIKAVKPDFQVTVMFYDYGTLKTYSPDAIYYLHKRFSILPAQAIPCGLINTRPCTGSKWSRSATHQFALRTSDIPLVATIATINKEDNSMMVNLTDTLEDEDVHINDWLVEQKLAEYGKMVCIKKRNFPIRYYLECQERSKRQKFSDIHKIKEKLSKNSGNEIVHNPDFDIGLSHSSNFNEVNSNKEDSYNKLISHRGKSKRSEYFESTNSSKNDFLIEKMHGSVTNPEKKHPRKTESLYKMLLHLKLKSIDSTKINNDNNDNSNNQICETIANKKCLDSSSVLNQPIEQKSYEKSVISCHNNMEHNNTTSDTSSIDLSANNRKGSKTLDDECNILKKRTNIPKQYGSVTNTEKKHPRKTESLYKMLLHLKLKSIDSTKINNDNNDNNNNQICETIANKKCLDSSSVLNQPIEQKSYEKSVISCHNNMEHNNTTSDTSSIDLSANNRKSSKTLGDECNILKERANIPKQYANHFDIQESEDEVYISEAKNFNGAHEVYITENIDWSVILKNPLQENNYITQKSESKIPRETSIRKQSNVPLAENCFLKVVYNSSYSALHDKDIPWSPTGNIAKTSNVSPLILENIERRKKRIKDNVIIAMSQKMLGMLTDEKLYDASRNVKDMQPMSSSQKTNNNSVENDTSLIALKNYEQNDYICMKTITSKQKLLEKLSSIKDISNDNSSLDSDDLSTLTESTSFHYNIDDNNNNNKCKGYESNTNIHESTSNESWSEIDVECSVKTEAMNSNTQEFFKPMINNSEVYEKEEIMKSANNLGDLTLVSTSSQQSTTIEKSDLIENIKCSEESSKNVEVKESVESMNIEIKKSEGSMEKSLLNEKTRQTGVVSVKELIQSNTVIETSNIPVFNDVDIESNEGEEQLDAHISYAELSNHLKTTFNESIQIKSSDNEFDSRLSTVEINDSNSVEDAKCIETYKNTESDTHEVMYSDRISNQEDKVEDLTNRSIKAESHIPAIHSENNSEGNNKYTSNLNYKSQGKARALVEMLNDKCKKYENDANIHECTSNRSWSEIDIECKKYESSTDIHESTLNESWSEIDVECSVKTEAINSNSQEFFKSTINNLKVYEKEEISTSTDNLEDLTPVPTSSQQSTTTEKSDLIKSINCSEESSLNVEVKESVRSMEKSLLSEETRQKEVVSVEGLIKSNTVIEKSDIPVFNDIDIESDEEEEQWDVHISYAELSNFLKSTFNGSTQNKFSDNEFNSRLSTAEINDSNSIENENCIETYTNIEGDTYEVMYSDRISNQEDKMEDLTNRSIEAESHIPVIHSENNSERSNKHMSNLNYKSQGKARKLIEMLNKAKMLQKDGSYK